MHQTCISMLKGTIQNADQIVPYLHKTGTKTNKTVDVNLAGPKYVFIPFSL